MITPYNIAPDFVRKFRAGPSILDLFGKCRRAWALRYIAGHDSYSVTWAEVRDHVYDKSLRMYVPPGGGQGPAIAPRQRSTALGTEAHRIVESHYLGRAVAADWTTFPGQVAQAWLDVMPGPEECEEVYTETAISLAPPPDMVGAPTLEGTSDLLLRLKAPRQDFDHNWLAGDWKTSRSFQYAKTAAELYTNSQGILYPLAAMRRLGLDSIPCRWAYSITDPAKRREARATDFVQTREHAEAAARPLFQAAAEMRAIYDAVAHMEPLAAALSVPATGAPSACEAFGGCPHSVERGGACTAPLEMTTGQRMLAERETGRAKTCAPAPAVVPLEALLRRSIDQKKDGKERYMSPFQKKLQELQNAQAAGCAVVPAVAEARASSRLDGETRVLDPQPVTPDADMTPQVEATSAPLAPTRDADTGEVLNPQPDAPVSVAETADVLSAPVLGQAQTVVATVTSADAPPPRRGPGRPRGSRNKAPIARASLTVPMGDVALYTPEPHSDVPEEMEEADGSIEAAADALNRQLEAERDFDRKYNTAPVSTGIDSPAALKLQQMLEEPSPESPAMRMARAAEVANFLADINQPEAEAPPDITLSQLAAAAKAHGCRIVVRFDGLKPAKP